MAETFQAAVERLKSKENAKAFGLHTPEDKAIFSKAGYLNCLELDDYSNWVTVQGDYFHARVTYAIAEDYQPEPEKPKVVDLSVTISQNNRLKVIFNDTFWHISDLPSLPGFRGFWDEDDCRYATEWVAEEMKNGKRIVARMEVVE